MLNNLFAEKYSDSYERETIDILRLIRSENVGPKTFHNLIKFFGSAAKALENIADFSLKGGRQKPIKVATKSSIEKELEAIKSARAGIITYKDFNYSRLLLHMPDFPPVLSYKGNISLLNNNKIIAIVGARNSSINSRNFAGKISKELVAQGYVTVSGLARGIDTAVHEASDKRTIAVIAGGIDHIYPRENKNLFKKISEEALLIAELPIGSSPLGQHFPQRNRIIAGLAGATAVIEASLKSGSLITARYALEYNRDIFAVPGFPLDPRCIGTNKLIKEGAYLLESSEDIILNTDNANLSRLSENDRTETNFNINFQSNMQLEVRAKDRKRISELLSSCPVTIEQLSAETNLPLPIIYTICLELELAGRITRHVGNKISLIY